MPQFGFKQIRRYRCFYLHCSVLADLLHFKNIWGAHIREQCFCSTRISTSQDKL